MTLTFAGAFSGIGGIELGFERAGIQTSVHIEKEKNRHPCLKEHWSETPIMEDIADVSGTDLGRIDGLAAGFPCKDISRSKANRKGLAGPSSSAFFHIPRLVNEYVRIVDESNPRWVLLENAPDLVTSRWNGGRDMGTALRILVELGYGMAWRVFSATGFGTPQRRRRIILVGHRGGDPRPAGQVLALLPAAGEHAGPRDAGVEEPRLPVGPIAVRGDVVRVWRKGINSQVAIRFHDHPTCPPPYADGKTWPPHRCQGTPNPAFRETWLDDGYAQTLTANDGPSPTRQKHLIAQGGRVRGLTPIEWERLQGFPDNWTAPLKYSARYDALGNAMHVGMAEWIGRRIVQVHTSLPMIERKSA